MACIMRRYRQLERLLHLTDVAITSGKIKECENNNAVTVPPKARLLSATALGFRSPIGWTAPSTGPTARLDRR